MKLAFQTYRFGKHLVKAVIIGGYGSEILLKRFGLQQKSKIQAKGDLNHHAGGTGALSKIDFCFNLLGHITHFIRGNGHVDIFF